MPHTKTVRHNGASVKLIQMDRRLYALSGLYSQRRRQGNASEVMWQACRWADEEKVILRLLVQRYGHPLHNSLDNVQLQAFYERFGFTRDPGQNTVRYHPVSMTRYPQDLHVS